MSTLERVSYHSSKDDLSPVYEVDLGGCNMTTPHEVLQCSTVPGAGTQLEWSIVIAEQVRTYGLGGGAGLRNGTRCREGVLWTRFMSVCSCVCALGLTHPELLVTSPCAYPSPSPGRSPR
jgi:hypothetical protein